MEKPQDGAPPPGSQAGGPPGGAAPVRWWDPWDAALVAARSRAQVDLIIGALSQVDGGVGAHRDGAGVVEYLYRPGVVLTRTDDAARVYAALNLEPPPDVDEPGPGGLVGLHIVRLPRDREVPDILAELDEALGVGVAVPEHVLHVCPVTWCNAVEAQPTILDQPVGGNTDDESTGEGRFVAVVDTGLLEEVVRAHPWLEGVTGIEEPPSVGHYRGHGTFIAGVVRTYAPGATVDVASAATAGGAVFETDLVAALVEVVEGPARRPDVISLSGGTRTRLDLPLLSFEVFWQERLEPLEGGTILVAAAGNDGDEGPFWPAASDWAVGVGALDEEGVRRVGFSNYGDWVDVYALGSGVVNAYPTGSHTYREPPLVGQAADFPNGMAVWSGTSFAAPMVAGLTAARLTWSGESPRQAVDALLVVARADPGPDGEPRLRDASAASR